MNTPTYSQQFDKLTTAYINGEVERCDCKKCFVGNLLNNKDGWENSRSNIAWDEVIQGHGIRTAKDNVMIHNRAAIESVIMQEANGFYTAEEVLELEGIFMSASQTKYNNPTLEDREQWLFEGFEKALDLLKSIHESKGEIIDAPPQFQKRNLSLELQTV